MTIEFPAIDRGKSPLLDADHDAFRIANALRTSPHFRGVADAHPGEDTVRFTSAAGNRFALTLRDPEPTDDDLLPDPVLIEAVAAAILNHPHFVVATPDSPREDTITVQTRNEVRYLLVLDVDRDTSDAQELSTPAADVAFAADQLLTRNGDAPDRVSERALGELLNYVAATWDKQDVALRQHAQAVARSLPR